MTTTEEQEHSAIGNVEGTTTTSMGVHEADLPRRARSESNPVAFASVDEYVRELQGKRPIKSVLIANNGISAVKAIRSIRSWSYEMFADEHKVTFVVMATPEDLRANAEYIRMAEHVVEVPGGANNNNYANVTLIVEIAERYNVDAVWAGWGHASENPMLPTALLQTERQIVFIGPPAKPMRALGDKIGSTIIAQSARVPTIAWNGDGIHVNYKEQDGIPEDVYTSAQLRDFEHCLEECKRIGFPVMIKASEGGGGKGIRKILEESQVQAGWEAVRGEIPGSPIFVMKLAPRSRHLEVQLLADEYGNAIALSGRDCSVQRRHQKIVEEGPVLAPSPEVWDEMMRAATRLAKEVGYINAGTVEYLFSELPEDEGKAFFFLELNPRLQVEHPVTEMITNVNLPAAQLQVAMGIPLHCIPDVRRLYQKDAFGRTPIDFEVDKQAPPNGHVIAARITAEDPNAGFQPTSGSIKELNFRSTPDVWGYFSVDSSGQVHEFADSQIGHLFSWSTSRDRARKNMILALKELSIRGDIHTTVEYIVNMMESDDFVYNRIHTAWLDERISRHKEVRLQGRPDPLLVVMVGAVCSAFQASNARMDEYVRQLERGQLPTSDMLSQYEPLELIYEGIKYNIKAYRSGPIKFTLVCNDSYVQVEIRTLSDGGFLVLLNGKSHVAYATKEAQGLRLVLDGTTCVFTKEYDPTRLVTNTAGKLARYLVEDGAKLRRGMPFAEIEVMKMYMPLLTPEAGVIRLLKSEGAVLAPGDCIATMELEDPSCVKKSETFLGTLPQAASAQPLTTTTTASSSTSSTKSLHKLRAAQAVLHKILDGYFVAEDLTQRSIVDLFAALNDPLLPIEELKEAMSPLAGRIPLDVFAQITDKLHHYRTTIKQGSAESGSFDVAEIVAILDTHKASLENARKAADFDVIVAGLRAIADKYTHGLASALEGVLTDLISQYYMVENVYARSHNVEDVVLSLRQQHAGDLTAVYAIARSHMALETKNKVLLQLLAHMSQTTTTTNPSMRRSKPHHTATFLPLLEKLAEFKENHYSLVALEARQILMDYKSPSYWDRLRQVEQVLREIIADNHPIEESPKFTTLLDHSQPLFDLLLALLDHEDVRIRETAMELYIRRIYRSYVIESMETKGIFAKKFEFKSPTYDVLSMGMNPTESYDDLASLVHKNGSSVDLVALQHKTDETDETKFTVEVDKVSPNVLRHGAIVRFSTLEAMRVAFDDVIAMFPLAKKTLKKESPVNVLHVILLEEKMDELLLLQDAEMFLKSVAETLQRHNIRRVTFAVRPQPTSTPSSSSHANGDEFSYPGIYTFPMRLGFAEDKIVRHIEAPLAYKLELRRLRNYNVVPLSTDNKNVHLYLAKTKESDAHLVNERFQRLFVRAVVRQLDRAESTSNYDAYPGPERTLVDALNALELAMGSSVIKNGLVTKNNHVFLNILPEAVVDPQYLEGVIRILASRYADRLEQLRISQVELKINARFNDDASPIPVRLVATNPTGYVLRVEAYVEAAGHSEPIFTSIGDEVHGELDGMPVNTPYPIIFPFDKKREMAKAMSNTVYVYDFIELIEHALLRAWRRYVHERSKGSSNPTVSIPNHLMDVRELILDASGSSVMETDRPRGKNDVGMVAWVLTMYTPEYPQGRDVVIIANDITFKAGSFGTREDRLFELASKYARARGIPRLFFSANAGARIGMAEAIKALYKICWKDETDPVKGFEYLYLTPEDYKTLSAEGSVQAELRVTSTGEERYVVTDIVGKEMDLGVECLRGSGTIAGETSRAYQEVFTLTYACGRSVGIGAYLVRLGHRTVQNATHAPIILTGFQALNKLMGKDVYTSNDQLGGVKIMHTNGVTHMTAKNHLHGVYSIVEWLSFVPAVRRGVLPIRDISGWDVIERPVEFYPAEKGSPYDPRHLLAGKVDESTGKWLSGFMDKGSFRETLDGWAKTVVVGRARLGGIPCGVVVTEVRTAEKVIPADPASPATQENLIQQAGQVWFPDSAHKTATAIKDFKGEDLPLFIFANWRGFSGGQRDMFDEVLKFGAAIVDGLVNYEQPVFVYIPPYAELRGGAWAVVDPTINEGIMEMYADPAGRGGVLEPAGLIEIKYRKKQLLETMHRLDAKLQALQQRLSSLTSDEREREEPKLLREIKNRENALLPVYVQVATEFADLHDTPGRMKAKSCIREVVEWTKARSFFYWRLKRQLSEFAMRREIMSASVDKVSFKEAEQHLKMWFTESVNAGRVSRQTNVSVSELWATGDKDVLHWFASDKEWIRARLVSLKRESTTHQVVELGLKDPKAAVAGILELLHQLSQKDREEAVAALRRGSIFTKSGSHTKLNAFLAQEDLP